MSTDPPKSPPSGLKAVETAEGTVAYEEATNREVDESKLVRKLDWHLIPLVMLLCESEFFLLPLMRRGVSWAFWLTTELADTFSFLDRSVS